jgi:hypothetical protein
MSVRVEVVRLSLGLALCVSMPGCKKQGESSSPSMDHAGEARAPHDSDPVAELAALEGRMRAYGLPVAADKNKGRTGGGDHEGVEHEVGKHEDDGMTDAVPTGAGGSQPTAEEAPAPGPADTYESARDDRNYCGDLCSLSESICTLEVRICSLAESHGNDATYADACERAVDDCEVAGRACDGCE